MRYTVVWDPEAEDELARLWMQSFVQRDITSAANAIDIALRDDPLGKGIILDHRKYELYLYPLRVLFKVTESDRLVQVLTIRLDLSAG